MVAYDLGANVGYVSLMLAKQVGEGGSVFAIEPLPGNQERLRANLTLNPQAHVVLVPKAVANESGSQAFHVHTSDDMGKLQGSAGRAAEYKASIKVETIALDDFAFGRQNPPPDVIKMDVEGGEVLALIGMRRLLAEKRPLLFIETHGPEAARGVREELQEANYKIYQVSKGYPEVLNVNSFDWKNYILARPVL
jgi:FkbM family methyltransferase